jgi:hypothetical protein
LVYPLIAGQAKAREMTLVTLNTTDFQQVPGLKVEDWKRATAPPATARNRKSSAKPRSEQRARSQRSPHGVT